MDITTIDAVSFATRVGHTAASELYGLLLFEQYEGPLFDWFNNRTSMLEDEPLAAAIEALGQYVCLNSVDQGERLYRWGQMKAIVPAGNWADLDVAGKQAFEAFTLTTRHTYLGLAVAQQAVKTARAAVAPPAPLKREDSIFESTGNLGDLRPEAIAAQGLTARFEREGEEERRRQEAIAAEERKKVEAKEAFKRRMAEGNQQKRQAPPAIAAGETLVQQQPNKGGRGNRKAGPNPA